MADYKPGALAAFLAAQDGCDEAATKPKNKLFEKKPKKSKTEIVSDHSSTNAAASSTCPEDVTAYGGSDELEQKTRKRRQSYGKIISDDEKQRTLFVGNLPVDVSRKALKRLFAKCGPVETVRLRSAVPVKLHMPKKAAVIKRQVAETQETLNAYVKFQEPKPAREALKLNGTVFEGRHMQVDLCSSAKRYDDKTTVFLGNLPFDADEESLYEHFSDCGDIDRVRLVRDRRSGSGKGFGFIVFKEPTSVSFALKLNGETFKNREIRITRVVKKRKLQAKKSTKDPYVGSKKQKKVNTTPNRQYSRVEASGSKTPAKATRIPTSKRVRGIVKKRKAKKQRKSYMSTF